MGSTTLVLLNHLSPENREEVEIPLICMTTRAFLVEICKFRESKPRLIRVRAHMLRSGQIRVLTSKECGIRAAQELSKN